MNKMISLKNSEKQHLKDMNIKDLYSYVDILGENEVQNCEICKNIEYKLNKEMFGNK
jgi:hypothetical protein